jgi:Holliday junction DNA helicase RuvA
MIESLRGYVEGTSESAMLISTGPVVISVLTPGYYLRRVKPGDSVEIPVYFHLQMEGNRVVPLLVGFPDARDREFFEAFISVSGVGVKAAVRALEQPPERIAEAITTEDYKYLTSLPGIGMKRARQIVAGLQDKMKAIFGEFTGATGVSGSKGEARAVLRQLGISLAEADSLIKAASEELDEDAATSEIVRAAMRIRNRQ